MSIRVLLRVLMLIALVVAPVSMMSSHAMAMTPPDQAASSHPSSMDDAGGHCADMGDQDDRNIDASIECMIACAGLLPPTLAVEATRLVASAPEQPALAAAQHGLNPAADPPPPRLS